MCGHGVHHCLYSGIVIAPSPSIGKIPHFRGFIFITSVTPESLPIANYGKDSKTPQSDEQQPKNEIDNILEEMSDGDSSFVSDSSAGGDASTATGLTGTI